MKKILLILAAALIIFVGYRAYIVPPRHMKDPASYQTIVCFGDSLTYGTGAQPGADYPSQLSSMIGKPVINAGVPGDTTARALSGWRGMCWPDHRISF